MSSYKEIYRLFKYTRCYGANINRENCIKEYVMENSNMDILADYIKNATKEKEYTFCIQKVINNDIRWRELPRHNKECWGG